MLFMKARWDKTGSTQKIHLDACIRAHQVFDTNGKLLSKNTKAIEAGTHTLAVQPALKTGAGMYVLRIASNHTVETRKVYFIP